MTGQRMYTAPTPDPNWIRFLIVGFTMPVVMIFSSCGVNEKIVKDFTQKATSTHRLRPGGDNGRISFTGYLYDTEGETAIIVTSRGDTITQFKTSEQTYTLSLELRKIQRVDFINDGRVKTMLFVNFTEVSERETFDVFFRNPDCVTFLKVRPRDNEWRVIYWRPTKKSVQF